MPVTINLRVAPFYNEESGVPPPLPCILTDQLELFGHLPRTTSLLADEALPSALTGAGTLPSRSQNTLTTARIPSPLPYPTRKSPKPPASTSKTRAASNALMDDGSTDSASTSDSESTVSALSELTEYDKIPKPPGEPGRPGRGGYTLEAVLGWNAKTYSRFKKVVHGLIEEHLDTTKCASVQNQAQLKLVKEKAKDKFPDLENYSNCWPINDLIMMRLKYTSSRARRRELENASGNVMASKGKKVKQS